MTPSLRRALILALCGVLLISFGCAHALTVTLTFSGDAVLGSDRGHHKHPLSFDNVIKEKGFGWPFSRVLPLFQSDDLSIVNLEGVLQNDERGFQKRQHNFRGDTAYTAILQAGHVEKVNLANNHHIDYGKSGRESTKKALAAAGVAYSGYGELYVYEKEGVKIGFGGIRETTYKQKKDQLKKDIDRLKEMGAHYIVYAMHFGNEYQARHNELQQKMAHEAIDLGANLIIGHHPHVVQGMEVYKHGLIFYSLGNFIFGGNRDLTTFDGLLVQTALHFDGTAFLGLDARLHPILTSGDAPKNDFAPLPAAGEDLERILSKIQQDTDFHVQPAMAFHLRQGAENAAPQPAAP